MAGMTIKQWHKQHFLELCRAYKAVDVDTQKQDFIAISVALHAAKGHVPKRMWRMARRDDIYPPRKVRA